VTPVEAAHFLMDAGQRDPDLRRALAGMVERSGCDDLVDWVEEHPDMAAKVAESVQEIDSQITEFGERLARKDLS